MMLNTICGQRSLERHDGSLPASTVICSWPLDHASSSSKKWIVVLFLKCVCQREQHPSGPCITLRFMWLTVYCFLRQNDVVVSWRPSSEFPGNVWESSNSLFLSQSQAWSCQNGKNKIVKMAVLRFSISWCKSDITVFFPYKQITNLKI